MNILVTGGAGYIGSHTCISLLENEHNVIIIDNLCNSEKKVIDCIEKITKKQVVFYDIDVRNQDNLRNIFRKENIDAVIHFAGLKSVGDSIEIPLSYYQNNLTGTLNLLEVMNECQVYNFIFSSSATVYGKPKSCPINEEFPLSVTNPYGRTKLISEDILKDLCVADKKWNVVLLRYFNPIGAHKSGLIGENTKGIPNNIFPYIGKVALGELKEVSIFGNDYDTIDGTGVRDYIHVCDLAEGHLAAINHLKGGISVYNLGTGTGYSVLELIDTFEKTNNVRVPYVIVGRRKGDVGSCYADVNRAKTQLGWVAKRSLTDMCKDFWHFIEVTKYKQKD